MCPFINSRYESKIQAVHFVSESSLPLLLFNFNINFLNDIDTLWNRTMENVENQINYFLFFYYVIFRLIEVTYDTKQMPSA